MDTVGPRSVGFWGFYADQSQGITDCGQIREFAQKGPLCSTIDLTNTGPAAWNPQKAGFWCIIIVKNTRKASASGRPALMQAFPVLFVDYHRPRHGSVHPRNRVFGTVSFKFRIHWNFARPRGTHGRKVGERLAAPGDVWSVVQSAVPRSNTRGFASILQCRAEASSQTARKPQTGGCSRLPGRRAKFACS
jgi:hypothetical protein